MPRTTRIRALIFKTGAIGLAGLCTLTSVQAAHADATTAVPASSQSTTPQAPSSSPSPSAAAHGPTAPATTAAPATGAPAASNPPSPSASEPATDPDSAADGPLTTAPNAVTPDALATASAKAASAKSPVVVDALTSQTSSTSANPDGTFTTTVSTVASRVKRHGTWVPVDTTLHVQADGTLAPAAVPGTVALSGGGTGPMTAQGHGGVTIAASWPTALPKPTVSGDTATYSEVLPGVDLKITVTVSGVRQIIVVKNGRAAANPALAALSFAMTATGGTISTGSDGSLSVTDSAGKTTFHGGAPMMWDSSGSAAEAAAAPAQAPSTARKALMGLKLTASAPKTTATLTPAASLLTDPDAAFPLYLDPDTSMTFGDYDTVWDLAPDANYTDNGDSLRSGYVYQNNPNKPNYGKYQTNRSFLSFTGLSILNGKSLRPQQPPQLILYDSYSSSCTPTPVGLWATDSITTATTWRNEPNWAYRQDDQTFAFGYSSSCSASGSSVVFHPTQQVQAAINGGWDKITMGLKADNESDASAWKIFESVKPGYVPKLIVTWNSPAVAPTGLNVRFNGGANLCGGWAGKISDLNATKLLIGANFYSDNGGDFVTINARVSDNQGHSDSSPSSEPPVYGNYGNGIGTPIYHDFAAQFSDSWLQNDGNTITVTITSTNLNGQSASASCSFQVDSVSPGTPDLWSSDFPREDWGPTTTQGGGFTILAGPNSGHVTHFQVVADGNNGNSWTQNTANGANAGFAIDCPGCAYKPFTTPGLHWLTVQAVSIAGNSSNLSGRYYFFVSPNTVQSDTASTLTYGAVGTTVAPGIQNPVTDNTGAQFAQVLLWGAPNGSGLWLNDSPKEPGTGYFAVQATMTGSYDYGKVLASVTQLDASGKQVPGTTQQLAATPFDGYSAFCCTRQTVDFGGARLSSGTTYQFTFTASGANSASTSPFYNIGISQIRLVPLHLSYLASNDPNVNLAQGFNVIAIADGGGVDHGFDGGGSTYSAAALAAAGYGSGANVTIDGVPFRMPTAAPGTYTAMNASGQEIGLGNATGSAIGLLGAESWGGHGGTGQITYANPCNGSKTQPYTIAPVPDWTDTSAGGRDQSAVSGISENPNAATKASLFPIVIPVACQNDPLVSVNLPWISPTAGVNTTSLKVLSVGVRPKTQGSPYVASWATSLDSTITAGGNTVRMPVRTSIGGTTARIRLDNPYATAPVTVATASIGVQSSGASTTGTPVRLKFGGQASVTIPPGGQIYSDPTTGLVIPPNSTLLVSLNLPNNGTYPAHGVSPVTTWTAGGDGTASTGAGFTTATTGWVLIDDLEVTPSSNSYQMGTTAVLGDQIGNGDASAKDANQRLSDDLATALPNIAGVVNVSSSGNRLLSDMAPGSGGPSAFTRLDRDVCELPNLSNVVIEVGDMDLHDGKSDAQIDGDPTTGVKGLAQKILTGCGATPVIVPVTPFSTSTTWNATGEPGSWNGIRSWATTTNLGGDPQAVTGPQVVDSGASSVLSDANTATKLAGGYDSGDHINLNSAGTQALANTIVGLLRPLPAGYSDRFPLQDVQADGTVLDTVNSVFNGWPSTSVQFVAGDRPGYGGAARFNGTDGVITVPDPGSLSNNGPLDTRVSFTVAAWVKLNSSHTNGGVGTVVAQNGNTEYGFQLGYDPTANAWRFAMQPNDSGPPNPIRVNSAALSGLEFGTWTHLAGVYDATTQKMSLYVNGNLAGTATFTPGNPPTDFGQQMVIGGGAVENGTITDFLDGDVSDVVLYNRTAAGTPAALNAQQIQKLYAATAQVGSLPAISGSGPSARLTLAATSAPGTPVTVDASGTTPGVAAITGYTIDFGDGTVVGPQTAATANHAYTRAGTYTYTVKLTVTDAAGNIGTATAPITIAANTLVSNAGFEAGSLAGWPKSYSATTTAAPRSGSYAAQITVPSGQATGAAVERIISGLTPNTSYQLSGWVRTDGGTTILGVKNYDSTGDDSGNRTTATGWVQLNDPFTTGPANTSADIYCYRSAVGTSDCDDIQLEQVPAAAPGAVANAGLETGDLAGWADSYHTAITTTNPHTGGYAAQINADTSGAGALERVVTGLTPNTAYTLTGWVRTDGGATILGAKSYNTATGDNTDASTTNTGWTLLTDHFTTGATDTSVDIYCYRSAAGSSACDDITLTSP